MARELTIILFDEEYKYQIPKIKITQIDAVADSIKNISAFEPFKLRLEKDLRAQEPFCPQEYVLTIWQQVFDFSLITPCCFFQVFVVVLGYVAYIFL